MEHKYECNKSLGDQVGLIKKRGAPMPVWKLMIVETCKPKMNAKAICTDGSGDKTQDEKTTIDLFIQFIDEENNIISHNKRPDDADDVRVNINKEVSKNLTFDELKKIIDENDPDLKIRVFTELPEGDSDAKE